MTVAELIRKLEDLPPDISVRVYDANYMEYQDLAEDEVWVEDTKKGSFVKIRVY